MAWSRAQSCGISSVVAGLSPLLGQSEGTVRQRLREWDYDAKAQKGEQRQAVEVRLGFAGLLRWLLSGWPPGEHRLALALAGSHALGSLHRPLDERGGSGRCSLAIAVPTLWVVSGGGQADASRPCSSLQALPELPVARRRSTKRSRPRLHSCFAQGLRLILVAFLQGEPLPLGRFIPEPWPSRLPSRKKATPKNKPKKKKSKGKGHQGKPVKKEAAPAASQAAA